MVAVFVLIGINFYHIWQRAERFSCDRISDFENHLCHVVTVISLTSTRRTLKLLDHWVRLR